MPKFPTTLCSNRRTTYLAALFSLPFILSHGYAQEIASSPLERTDAYSLFVDKEKSRDNGYFPMGFVHGLAEKTVGLGFNFQQGVSSANNTFAQGTPLSVPTSGEEDPNSLRYGMRSLSMARPAEALGSLLRTANNENRLPVTSKKYGSFVPAIAHDGKPRAATVNVFQPATRQYLIDYVREHVKARTGSSDLNQSISLWGLDNEWEGHPDYSPEARAAFGPWLEKTYKGQIGQLNASWKSSFADFASAAASKMPDEQEYAANPGLFLDWMNFQSENFSNLVAEMAKAMYDTDPQKRGVILKSTQQTIEMPVVNRRRTLDHDLLSNLIRPYSRGLIGIDCYGAGDREAYEVNYMANCIRPLDYWTNPKSGQYGVFLGEANNHSGPGHQFASTYWRVLSNGLKGINYFTLGFAGAQHDWDTFGFIDNKTGAPKEKLYYAARWANMVHRTEKFWTESRPAPTAPRVAILMPRRDVLLADKDPKGSIWSYQMNSRWMLMRWLREQGYWVDIIPYSKLNTEYLKAYKGLFLVGADHLSRGESEVVKSFVQSGGTLVVDTRAGYWDEHHRVTDSLKPLLGVKLPAGQQNAPLNTIKYSSEKTTILSPSNLSVVPESAKVVTSNNQPPAYLNKVGKGSVLYFPFELGALSTETTGQALDKIYTDGPTADNEEYAAFAQEFTVGQWLSGVLKNTTLSPAYRLIDAKTGVANKIRVEQPFVDANGNCAIIIANRAQTAQEVLPATTIELTLPAGNWQTPLWAGAEDDGLQPVKLTKAGANYRVEIPAIRTAGVLYFFKNHPPLLGITQIAGTSQAIDKATAQVKPGQPFKVNVQLFNPNAQPLPAGQLKLQAVNGWKATPAVTTQPLAAGKQTSYQFEVTPESNEARIRHNWVYPLVAHWEQNGQRKAVIAANVELQTDPQKMLKVLSDNPFYPETYPYRIKTGLSYSYPNPTNIADPASEKSATGQALLNGFSGANIGSRTSGRANNKQFAAFNTKSADVLFDLKSFYRVRQLVIVPGPGKNAPTKIQIATSENGTDFQLQNDMTLSGIRHEIRSGLFDSKARYVRLSVDWAAAGGTLDEVEILGLEVS